MTILVTGAAGFIGYHLCQRLATDGHQVVGIDNLYPYYDPQLKQDRLNQLSHSENFHFIEIDIADRAALESAFSQHQFSSVINLAAQPGVRYSIENPEPYIQTNLVGYANILECCRHHKIKHLVYASSSSVYGLNEKMPYSEDDRVDQPISLYAATKKSGEMLSYSYAHLYGIPMTGLRFFTVYGPWGRPDMAIFKFTRDILSGKPIDVYNHGKQSRDFTFIDDIVEGIVRVLAKPPTSSTGTPPHRVFNIGRGQPTPLMEFITAIENATGESASLNMLPAQPGDVTDTWADTANLFGAVGYQPQTTVSDGIDQYVAWFRKYYQ